MPKTVQHYQENSYSGFMLLRSTVPLCCRGLGSYIQSQMLVQNLMSLANVV